MIPLLCFIVESNPYLITGSAMNLPLLMQSEHLLMEMRHIPIQPKVAVGKTKINQIQSTLIQLHEY